MTQLNLRCATLVKCCCVLLFCYLIYNVSGVLFGTFRTDEIYFLTNSFAIFRDYPHYENNPPPIFEWLLTEYWGLINGQATSIWSLRLLMLVIVAIQGWLIYNILNFLPLRGILSCYRPWLQLVFVACSIVIISAYRGYEIRPEATANTLLLACSYAMLWLLESDRSILQVRLVTLVTGIGLIVMGSLSYRYTISSLILFSSLFCFAWSKMRRERSFILCVFAWLGLALYLNFFLYNIVSSILEAADFQGARVPFTVREKVFLTGEVQVYIKWALLLVLVVQTFRFFRERGLKAVVGAGVFPIVPMLCLMGYYFFLFIFDVRPFGYVLSLEYILIFLTVCFFLFESRAFVLRREVYLKLLVVVFAIFIIISTHDGISNLNGSRNPKLTLQGLWRSASMEDISKATDVELLRLMASSFSVLDQSRARGEYCRRYPSGVALVSSYDLNPICMRDRYSRALAGWGGSVNLDSLDFTDFQYIALSKKQSIVMPHLEDFYWEERGRFTKK